MIELKKADQKLYLSVKSELESLYLDTFTRGISAQVISPTEAETYLKNLFSQGYGIFGFSNGKLVAALIMTPLNHDKECPQIIKQNFKESESEYIAEVLVDENYRGRGLGKALMNAIETYLDKTTRHVFLRVWDKNEAAVRLYENSGFVTCGHLEQEKTRPNSHEKFLMHKHYMVKTY